MSDGIYILHTVVQLRALSCAVVEFILQIFDMIFGNIFFRSGVTCSDVIILIGENYDVSESSLFRICGKS